MELTECHLEELLGKWEKAMRQVKLLIGEQPSK